MEISGFVIYLISIADSVDRVFGYSVIAGVVSWIVSLVIAVIVTEEEGEVSKECEKFLTKICKVGLFLFIFGILGATFTPSSKAVAAIYVIPKIVNNETLQAEANEFYIMAKEWLKTTLEDKPTRKTDDEIRAERKRGTEKKDSDKSSEKLEI